jgi:hypothetical protein
MSLIGKVGVPFRKLLVTVLVIVILGGATAVRIYYDSSARRKAEEPAAGPPPVSKDAPKPGAAKDDVPQPVTMDFGEQFANFAIPPEQPKKGEPRRPPPIPEEIKRRFVNQPTAISLFPPLAAPAKPAPPAPPSFYLPSFRLIRCELIGGPETGSIETPLIGVVLDNQYNIDPDGVTRLVIPAGVEVHGTGKSSPSRDRIDGNGKWTFVWRTNDGSNAMELTVSGIALNRDYDEAKHAYGDTEKSPGISGRRFGSLGDQAIQVALLASVAAITRSVQSDTSILNPLTSQVVNVPKATIGNALLEGGAAGTDRIADMIDAIRKQIDEKGYYVAVLPGKEFYLYTKEPIDLRKARRPGDPEPGAKAVAGGKDRS